MKTLSILLVAGLLALPAAAQERGHMAEMGDPYLPPAARKPSTAPPTSGEALRQQVQAKLRRQFEAADTQQQGAISADQARAAGLGYIANHFEQIDARHTGRVSFEQLQRYLDARRNQD